MEPRAIVEERVLSPPDQLSGVNLWRSVAGLGVLLAVTSIVLFGVGGSLVAKDAAEDGKFSRGRCETKVTFPADDRFCTYNCAPDAPRCTELWGNVLVATTIPECKFITYSVCGGWAPVSEYDCLVPAGCGAPVLDDFASETSSGAALLVAAAVLLVVALVLCCFSCCQLRREAAATQRPSGSWNHPGPLVPAEVSFADRPCGFELRRKSSAVRCIPQGACGAETPGGWSPHSPPVSKQLLAHGKLGPPKLPEPPQPLGLQSGDVSIGISDEGEAGERGEVAGAAAPAKMGKDNDDNADNASTA